MEALVSGLGALGNWAYVIVGAFAFLEASAFVGVVVPGETAVILAGFLAAQTYLSPLAVAVSASAGATLGDSVGYEVGRHFGRRLLARWRFHPRALERTERLFERHGGKAVFLGRFVGFMRAFAPLVAGVARMPYARFLVYNASGAILWATGATAVGYLAGASWHVIERWISLGGLALGVALLFLVVAYWRLSGTRSKWSS